MLNNKEITLGSLIIATAFSAGCSYKAPVQMSAAYNVNSSYEERVPGKWAIWIDGGEFKDSQVKPSSHACSFHTYTIDSSKVFERSALKTFANLVESIERVKTPIPAEKLPSYGYDGQIIINSEDLDVDLVFIPGFWTMTGEAEVEFEASLSAFIKGGKILGTTVSGEGEHKGEAGSVCSGGATMVGKAAEKGMKKTLRSLGERFASSTRIRENLATNE